MMRIVYREKLSLNDRDFIADIYEKHKDAALLAVYNYTYSKHEAEDIMQDAMVSLIRNAQVVKTLQEPLLTEYIVKCVKSSATDYFKARSKSLVSVIYLDPVDVTDIIDSKRSIDVEGVAEGRERIKYIFSIIDKLPERYRVLLLGRYVKGYDDNTLALMIGCKPASVRSLLCRAKKALIEASKKEGVSNDR